MLRALASTCTLLAVGCSSSSGGTVATTANPAGPKALPCDVDTILENACRHCHAASPKFGAPMPLVTYDDLLAPAPIDAASPVYRRVAARIHDPRAPMPPAPNAPLDEAALAALDAWIAAGAPAKAGSDACSPLPAPRPSPTSLSCQPDAHMAPAAPWEMPESATDAYVCYGFDVTNATKRHLVGIAPVIDNPAIVHHLVLFQADRPYSREPVRCAMSEVGRYRTVYGWGPGGKSFEFPPGAGYPQEGTTHYVVQVHYNNAARKAGQKDATGFDFCTTDQLRPNDADTMLFGAMKFVIPPRGAADVSCDYRFGPNTPPLHVFAAFPHMHQLGTAISTTKLVAEGEPIDLGTQRTWDFQSQVYFPVNATLNAGDTVRTRCAWTNPGDSPVGYGQRTADEMCFSFTMYWPRLEASGWSWMTPAATASCSPTVP